MFVLSTWFVLYSSLPINDYKLASKAPVLSFVVGWKNRMGTTSSLGMPYSIPRVLLGLLYFAAIGYSNGRHLPLLARSRKASCLLLVKLKTSNTTGSAQAVGSPRHVYPRITQWQILIAIQLSSSPHEDIHDRIEMAGVLLVRWLVEVQRTGANPQTQNLPGKPCRPAVCWLLVFVNILHTTLRNSNPFSLHRDTIFPSIDHGGIPLDRIDRPSDIPLS